MVALGPAFTGFCQQQLLHSQLSLEASERILRTPSGLTPDQEKTQNSTEEVSDFTKLIWISLYISRLLALNSTFRLKT